MINIEPLNGTGGCSANCATCPQSIKTLTGPRKDMNLFIARLVKLFENNHVSYAFSPTGNIDQLIPSINNYHVTKAEDIVTMAKFPETSIEVIDQVFNHMLTKFSRSRLTIGIVDKGVSISAAHRDAVYDIVNRFKETTLPFLLINLTNNYIDPKPFNQLKREFWESDELLYEQIRKQCDIKGRPLQTFRFNDNKWTHIYQSQGQFVFSKNKRLYIARRIVSPIDPISYNWKLFRESAKEVLQDMREQLYAGDQVDDIYLSPAPFGVRIQHQSFDSANPFLWLSYPEINRILDVCEKDLFHINDIFKGIERHIDAGLHIKLEEHISRTDGPAILKIGELRSGLIYNR